ncbi:recombinase family protein [Roseinatronobacter sp. NSM]|uniref:recombinase family protein n=1 Tax=Roseinatronobacter sp. NSM TaxID=3457785 RepID=UPI00403578AE
MTARRVALYMRVSTTAQDLAPQRLRLKEVAERAGWEVVQEYVETISGAKSSRPELDRMMADARRRRFDMVAAVDVSRLGRSLAGLAALFEEFRQIGCDLYLDREAVDTSTPAGRALLGMASVFAAFERDMTIERTKAGMAAARARGKRIGRPPASDAVVASIRALRAKGMAMDKISKELRCGKSLSMRVCQEFDRERQQEEHA